MRSLLKQLVGESAIYGISGIVTKFIGIFLVPLYTNIFEPSDYGMINIINSFFFFVGIFVVFALDNSAARWFYDTEDLEDRKKTISSWFWFQLLITTVVCSGIILLSGFLSKKLLHTNDPDLFIISAISVFTGVLPIIVQNWLRMQRKAVHTVVFSLLYSLLTIGLTIYFVLMERSGIIGVFYAVVISNSVASIYCIFLLRSWISMKYLSGKRLKEMLVFALPLIPTSIAFWVINSSSTFVLDYFYDLEEVGIFQLGLTISSAVTLFTSSFQMAWGPFAYSIIKKDNAKEVYSTVLTAYTIIANLIALSLALFAYELLVVFTTPNYYDAYLVAGFLSFNSTIYSYVYIIGIGNGIVKNNKPLAISVLLSAAVTTGLLVVLTPMYGKTGTAISMIIGNMIIPIYVYFSAQKRYHIPYKMILVLSLCGFSFGLYLLYLLIKTDVTYINIIIKGILIIGYIISGFIALYLWDRKSFDAIKQFYSNFKTRKNKV
ncbi:lipopolysaccharide biosynthesis protein [Fluviicola taffensis]|uniref:Polysaccharide biosynthesis protein n=1 Tax=Fluviicola taffensis (strain DSM 16823 / NCIMB 13979 / RW262) TaxID=755732 RepID=F2II27_FLUTR|nr:oligosaccharide flippase family protein [Fluviicola taffensis]AEA42727.1 polysaccharide biosynthesis protein [Fluviicola taffensis DSM 16823]